MYLRQEHGKFCVQLPPALQLVLNELEDDRPLIDAPIRRGFFVVVKKRVAADGGCAAGSQDVGEDDRAHQILGGHPRVARKADRLDRRIFGNDAASSTNERPAKTIELGAGMAHHAIAFRTPQSTIYDSKIGRNPDVAASEMMQKSLARQVGASASWANLAQVEMMTATSGAQADPVEKARFQIVAPHQMAEVVFNVLADNGVRVAMRGGRRGDRRERAAGIADLSQQIEATFLRGVEGEVGVGAF